MGSSKASCSVSLLQLFIVVCLVFQCFAKNHADLSTTLIVNASDASGKPIPETLFGIFFEEINHAGAGGIWAELVSNRGFEAGGPNTPSNIDPWSVIGNGSLINVETDRTSFFDRNKVALRLEVLCDSKGDNICPADGVGVYNPGFWGMNIEQGKKYKVVFYVRSTESLNLTVSLTGSNGVGNLASSVITGSALHFSNWTKVETLLVAKETNRNSRLQLTTTTKGVIWLDQVSAMPLDTYKGHGFRSELVEMLADLKPKFIRFPGMTALRNPKDHPPDPTIMRAWPHSIDQEPTKGIVLEGCLASKLGENPNKSTEMEMASSSDEEMDEEIHIEP
uniref:Alpha-L-arabinofuranosidase 1 n=1 Tax=Cajanus cajan TaxID=3821 RepID=A0A151TAF0_CAJCA|nr:Alpha-L-arabinofuranosidase 1 [Cajanus cajan]